MMMRVIIEDPSAQKGQGQKQNMGLSLVLTKAPGWTLLDNDGKRHRLEDLAGCNVLLVFVRSVSCSHCLRQLKVLARNNQSLRDLGLTVVVISPDSPKNIKFA